MTEGTLISDSETVIQALSDLSDLGIRLYIDDFGTGFSSLSYLSKFRPSGIKIDRSFIDGCEKNPDMVEIIHGIVHMGHSCRAMVIAEGVENSEQLKICRDAGCDAVQGYYFSRPREEARIKEYLRSLGQAAEPS